MERGGAEGELTLTVHGRRGGGLRGGRRRPRRPGRTRRQRRRLRRVATVRAVQSLDAVVAQVLKVKVKMWVTCASRATSTVSVLPVGPESRYDAASAKCSL